MADKLAEVDKGITISEACDILGYSRWTIHRLIDKGDIHAFGRYRSKRVSLDSVVEYMEKDSVMTNAAKRVREEPKRVSHRHKKAMEKLKGILNQ